jgi:DNA-binding NtrC family response regulator
MTATILIVDDEVNARLNIGGFLTTRGYEVLEASTLAEAREQLRQGNGYRFVGCGTPQWLW